VRLGLIASKPTDAVTYGFLPAAERLGLEVFLLTDQPEAHAGALARAADVTAGWPAGTGPAGERALTLPGPGRDAQARAGSRPRPAGLGRVAAGGGARLTFAAGTWVRRR
jgi:hypothetical protein